MATCRAVWLLVLSSTLVSQGCQSGPFPGSTAEFADGIVAQDGYFADALPNPITDVDANAPNAPIGESSRSLDSDDSVAESEDAVEGSVRLMIYRAELTVQVAQFEDASERFLAEIERAGGYLQRKSGQVVLCRVPAGRFEATLEFARRMGRLVGEQIEATDVTRQHRDLRIRLENALRSRDRLLAILEKASVVEDILQIETELRRLSGEIERYQAELRSLSDQVAFSTIEIRFIAPAVVRSRARQSPSRFEWINAVSLERLHRGF